MTKGCLFSNLLILSYAIIRTLGANNLFSKWIGVCVTGQILVAISFENFGLKNFGISIFFANLYIFPVLSFSPLFVCYLSKEISASL